MIRLCTVCIPALLLATASRAEDAPRVVVDPPQVELRGGRAVHSLLVTGHHDGGQPIDLTGDAHYRSANPAVADVVGSRIHAVGDGETTVHVEAAGQALEVRVRVHGTNEPRRFNFTNDIVPILSRFGCNSSGCHGKAEGQNGFKLSVFGFDPAADYAALVKESRGRRVFPASPDNSLLLTKMAGVVPHGGGARIRRGTPAYATLRDWIAAGTPLGSPDDPVVTGVRIEPSARTLGFRGRQQLRVIARYSDGREEDVTALARYQSNAESLARVDEQGLVLAGEVPGEAAIMASYQNRVDVFRVVVPRPGPAVDLSSAPRRNLIDELVLRKLQQLNIRPSQGCTDAEFLRRACLDVIGRLPTVEEARKFLADEDPDKRTRLVDDLLGRPEYADYWALLWADRLMVSRPVLGAKQAHAFHRWLHRSLRENRPADRLAREIITAEGPLDEVPQAAFYKAADKPGEAASALAQVFLGVRIACAECHHHPFDVWTQRDYHGMLAYFSGLSVRKTPVGELLVAARPGQVRHPRTGEVVHPYPLGSEMPAEEPGGNRRALLAQWLTSRDNPWFARNLANRVWAHFLGRGLIEPVDDVRATNPPTNPELLEALADHLVLHDYDVKSLIRLITGSQAYQLSSRPNETNERDQQNYSRALLRRPPAEVLFDMVCQSTGVPERFDGFPLGTRAVELWDSRTSNYFLRVFGRPERATACACERGGEPSVAQVLHLLNSPEVHDRLTHEGGTVARLVARHPEDAPLVEELYLTFFSRPPTSAELETAVRYLGKRPDRRAAAEDLAWSLLCSLEFAFNH